MVYPETTVLSRQTLIVPYYVFSLYFLAEPLAMLFAPSLARTFKSDHDYSMTHQFYDVLVDCNGLWFLWAFFIGELITYAITSLICNNEPYSQQKRLLLDRDSSYRGLHTHLKFDALSTLALPDTAWNRSFGFHASVYCLQTILAHIESKPANACCFCCALHRLLHIRSSRSIREKHGIKHGICHRDVLWRGVKCAFGHHYRSFTYSAVYRRAQHCFLCT